MCVCVYVCMCVCVYVCMYVCVCVCVVFDECERRACAHHWQRLFYCVFHPKEERFLHVHTHAHTHKHKHTHLERTGNNHRRDASIDIGKDALGDRDL